MSDDWRCDPESDCFKPPAVPTEVCCLHCRREYESYLIHWVEETDAAGHVHGFWCCPTPGCDGKGFGFDIHPTDPAWRDENGQSMWHDDEEDFDDDEPRDTASREAAAREEDILEYIYSGDTPRVIDPKADPTPDGADDDFDTAMFDEFGEPVDDLFNCEDEDDSRDSNDGDPFIAADASLGPDAPDFDNLPVHPWRPPLLIDPAITHLPATDPSDDLSEPPHRIGPIHVDFTRPTDLTVWEEDIPF